MNSCMKRRTPLRTVLSLLLSFMLVFGMLPLSANAAVVKAGSSTEGNLKYDYYSDGTAVITGPVSKNTLISADIPARIGGFRTVAISNNAFMGCRRLTEVKLPNTLTLIGTNAFSLSAIKKVTIPGSVQTISGRAFYACTSLEEVTILYGVKSIGDAAFAGCSRLTKLNLAPFEETHMAMPFGESAAGLTVVTVPGSVPSLGDCKGGFSVSGNLPDDSPVNYKYIVDEATGDVTVEGYFGSSRTPVVPREINGGKVTKLADGSFKNRPLTKVTLPDSLLTIGSSVFEGTGLQYIEIPDSVTGIGDNAFDDDADLTIKGSCPALDEYLKHTNQIKFVPYGPGAELYHNLKMVTSPANAGTIVKGSLSRDYRTGLVIPVQAKPTQGYLFKGWTTSPSISGALENANMSATNFTMPGQNVTLTANFEKVPPEPLIIRNGDVRAYFGGGPQVVIPNEYGAGGQEDLEHLVPVVSISDDVYVYPGTSSTNNGYVFSTGYVEELSIPASVLRINPRAFYNANTMQSITVATDNTKFSSQDGVLFNKDGTELIYYPADKAGDSYTVPPKVTKIGQYAFNHNKHLKSINLNHVKDVSASAFIYCESLTDIVMPEVQSIGGSAFESCRKLSSVAIPGTLTSLGSAAFRYCSALAQVTWGEGIQMSAIPSYTFEYCAFSSIDVPESVTALSSYSFGHNTNLAEVRLPATMTGFASDTLVGSTNVRSITVAAENPNYSSENDILFNKKKTVLVAYPPARATETPDEYTVPASVTELADGAFAYSRMTTLNMPNVVKIGYRTFWNAAITSIELTKVTSLGAAAFEDCDGLAEVTIPAKNQILNSLFQSCDNLTKVIVPDDVKSIGSNAFYNCPKLTTITLPEGLETIGSWAFYNCRSLESINLPSTLRTIGSEAFYNCASLKAAAIPKATTSIGAYAYEYCTSLETLTFDDSPVDIGYRAFQYCTSLKNVTLPKTVKTVGQYAFLSCTELASANVSAATVQTEAFYNCPKLTSLTLGEGVTSIGSEAFYGSRIASVKLPASLTSFGLRVFAGSPLEAISVAGESKSFSATDGVLYTKDSKVLYVYPSAKTIENGKFTAPDTVEQVKPYAFENAGLTAVEFGEKTASLAHSMFQGCQNLRTVTVRNPEAAFENVGYSPFRYVFYGVGSPEKLVVEGYSGSTAEREVFKHRAQKLNFRELDGYSKGIFIDTSGTMIAYSGTDPNLVIPSSVDNTMDGVTVVNSKGEIVTLADGQVIPVTAIGMFATMDPAVPMGMELIKSVKIPLSVKEIRMGAFDGCKNLTSEGLKLPESIEKIGYGAFSNCTSLTTVTIPKSVGVYGATGVPDEEVNVDISSSPFVGCTNLREINVEPGNKYYASINGVLTNSAKDKILEVPCAFMGDSGTYVIPEGILSIAASAFDNSELTRIVTPSSLKVINVGAFSGAFTKHEVSVELSEGLEEIKNEAFKNCTGLTEIVIPKSVLRIGDSVFDGCTNLQKFVVKDSNRGGYASVSDALCSLENNPDPTGPSPLTHLIRYPIPNAVGTVDLSTMPNLVEICQGAFEGSVDLNGIEIPDSVQMIRENAFAGCNSLTWVKLPTNLSYVGSNAFQGAQIGNLDLPDSLEEIGEYAFANGKIGSITLSNTLKTIKDSAFYGIYASDIVIPKSVTSIGISAFQVPGDQDARPIRVIFEGSGTKIDAESFMDEDTLTFQVPDTATQARYRALYKNVQIVVVGEPNSISPISDDLETETPDASTPAQDTPVTETPDASTPVQDTPVTETPDAGTLVQDTPVTETPDADTPVQDTPVTETPDADTPVQDTPVTETPDADTPVQESSDEV